MLTPDLNKIIITVNEHIHDPNNRDNYLIGYYQSEFDQCKYDSDDLLNFIREIATELNAVEQESNTECPEYGIALFKKDDINIKISWSLHSFYHIVDVTSCVSKLDLEV
jgi:hypothetical protein